MEGRKLPACVHTLAILGMAFTIWACAPANFSKDKAAQGPYICDPWGGGGNDPRKGLVGDLAYFDQTQVDANPQWPQSVLNYFLHGNRVDYPVFLNHLNYPTRPWSEGFKTRDGQYVKKANGENLFEWFAFQLRTDLKLTAGDIPGPYQVAMLSDDGSLVRFAGGTQIVNNDGITPTRLSIASQPIVMSPDQRLPLEILYTQGPRVRIAVVMLWRPWPADPTEPLNGAYGDNFWFDVNTNPSTPTANYQALLSRGWKPLSSDNFWLPEGVTNPCN